MSGSTLFPNQVLVMSLGILNGVDEVPLIVYFNRGIYALGRTLMLTCTSDMGFLSSCTLKM